MNGLNGEFWRALDRLIEDSEVVIDRPKGAPHPRFPEVLYPVDYGYLRGTASMDGGGIDVWVGSNGSGTDAILCTVDLMKKDSEMEILIGCTEEEKNLIYRFHNRTPLAKGILIRR